MMFLNNLMNSRNLTRAELSASSNIPESTLRDILNGKAQLDRCEAVTLYNLAYVAFSFSASHPDSRRKL